MNTSAEARVIASFTFIVALLMGSWGALDHLLAGPSSPVSGELGSIAVALVPFAVTAMAFQAGKAAEVAWARALGGAAVMLGILSCLGAIFYLLANT